MNMQRKSPNIIYIGDVVHIDPLLGKVEKMCSNGIRVILVSNVKPDFALGPPFLVSYTSPHKSLR